MMTTLGKKLEELHRELNLTLDFFKEDPTIPETVRTQISALVEYLISNQTNPETDPGIVEGYRIWKELIEERNSKAKDVIKQHKELNINVLTYDTLMKNEEVERIFNIKNTNFEDIEKLDAVVLITEHDKFKEITLEKLKQKMDKPILIDIKSFYNKKEAKKLGFIYKNL